MTVALEEGWKIKVAAAKENIHVMYTVCVCTGTE